LEGRGRGSSAFWGREFRGGWKVLPSEGFLGAFLKAIHREGFLFWAVPSPYQSDCLLRKKTGIRGESLLTALRLLQDGAPLAGEGINREGWGKKPPSKRKENLTLNNWG